MLLGRRNACNGQFSVLCEEYFLGNGQESGDTAISTTAVQ
ncbi:hypothetical protein A2U01_0033366, partial [Trifolium medium]|nr:hypothetical protein [Trifolium medium]